MIAYKNVGMSNILNNNRGCINYKRESIGLLEILSLICMPWYHKAKVELYTKNINRSNMERHLYRVFPIVDL